MRQTWSKLGGQLGMGCIAVGLLIIGLAWNGAAGIDFVSGQIPYLLSGGALGLGLIGVGAAMLVVQNGRRDRAIIEAQLADLNAAVSRPASAVGSAGLGTNGGGAARDAEAQVLAGPSSFHRPSCRLAEGKDLPTISVDAALAEGLTPCRICKPAAERAAEGATS